MVVRAEAKATGSLADAARGRVGVRRKWQVLVNLVPLHQSHTIRTIRVHVLGLIFNRIHGKGGRALAPPSVVVTHAVRKIYGA